MDIAHFTPVKRSKNIFKKSQEDSLCKKNNGIATFYHA